MFRNILVPTDGSALSRKAIKRAVQLAREQKGRVTGFYVGPAWKPRGTDESIPYRVVSPDEHQASVKKTATRILKAVVAEAAKAGVPCTTSFSTDDYPYVRIVEAATRNGCDLILMATHGRRGISRLLLGSETSKVLAHSKVPVLVCR
ncbi:MAG TPA: universal stress protein [Burkholderiales bacterium]|jgi:nucleotide-binding universal stress UspA family protein